MEVYLPKKAARAFMPHLQREISGEETVRLIEDVTLQVSSSRLDIFELEEEDSSMPDVPLRLDSLAQIVFDGDSRRFHRARASFKSEYGCEPENLP